MLVSIVASVDFLSVAFIENQDIKIMNAGFVGTVHFRFGADHDILKVLGAEAEGERDRLSFRYRVVPRFIHIFHAGNGYYPEKGQNDWEKYADEFFHALVE